MVVVQCPPRIEPSSGSVENLRGLFSTVEGGDCEVAWEPRGEWLDELELVEDLCEELNPVHCVELLGREPFHVTDTAYVRLHGLNEDPYDYDYNYTHDELERLADRLVELEERSETVYGLLDNYGKFNATRTLIDHLVD